MYFRFYLTGFRLSYFLSLFVRRIELGNEIMATMISFQFPNASVYPFVALSGFTEISAKVKELSTSFIGFSLIVNPDQGSEFESFAETVYQEQDYPQGAGASDFGFGIWRHDPVASPYDDHRVHDTSGNTTYGGKYPILVPLLQHSDTSSRSLMYNIYSENITGPAVDSVIDCSLTELVNNSASKCITLTNFVVLKTKPGPAALLVQPVYPVYDPKLVVGFSTAALVWEDVLNDIVPDHVNGLYCVISSETDSYTFSIENGKPKLLGAGDLHDTSFDSYKISAVISAVEGISTTASTFTLSVYPSKTLFDTKSPWSITIGFVLVIATCAGIFFVYDCLMRNEARQRKVIIEMKRRFVRFVSHEIRTPLNTVCLGLELLQTDLKSLTPIESDTEPEGTTPQQFSSAANDEVAAWSSLVDDILENANNAVGILNDLLNYDKMEQGTFNLDVTAVPICDVVMKTVSSFEIEAKKRSIQLTCTTMQSSTESGPDLKRLHVIGDDVRLRQIIRNLISNPLKFSPEGTGTIVVTMMHVPDGLPNAITPREDIIDAATSTTLACTYPRAGTIKITVKDNGVGLTASQLTRLFQEGIQFEPNKLQVRRSPRFFAFDRSSTFACTYIFTLF
jgi:signal transduction histidine kinase